MSEILVCRKHRQVVMNAKLRKQCIHRFDLYARAATPIAQFRRLNVIVPLRYQEL